MPGVTLSGRVGRILYQDDIKGFAVFELTPDQGDSLIVTGAGPKLVRGDEVRVTGDFRQHPRYGRQFRADTLMVVPAQTPSALAEYLASGRIPGVGRKLADRIVARFGARTRKVLDEAPWKLTEVPGIGEAKGAAIAATWQREQASRERFVILASLGLSAGQIARVDRALGDAGPAVIRNDPYQLVNLVPGVGFKTADGFATSIGFEPESPLRARAAVVHVMGTAAEAGHVFLPHDTLVPLVSDLLGPPHAPIESVIEDLVRSGTLVGERVDGEFLIFETSLHAAEVDVAGRLARLAQAKVPCLAMGTGADGDVSLAPSQRAALDLVARAAVAVLTGGPGTGKTTIVGSLIRAAITAGHRVALAAPTGRAAMRLKETSGQEAKTLHRLLEFNPRTGEFQRNELHPLEVDWVIVDESSMIDIRLMRRLLCALSPGVRLTLVGDADQLPPVGPGDPFRDVIASGRIPVARLSEVFRQGAGSAIVRNAHRVLAGEVPSGEISGTDAVGDFYVMHRSDAAAVAAAVETMVVDRIPARLNLDPRRDIMVLAPMHRGECGTDALNRALRARLNPDAHGEGFCPGDRVIENRNNYDKDVFNGDIGIVREVHHGRGVTVRFDGRDVTFEGDEVDDLSLAFAITVHKAQGSEFPAVVVCLHTQHYVMLRRNLLYTALTRGRRICVVCGNPAAIRMAVGNAAAERRNTRLGSRLTRM